MQAGLSIKPVQQSVSYLQVNNYLIMCYFKRGIRENCGSDSRFDYQPLFPEMSQRSLPKFEFTSQTQSIAHAYSGLFSGKISKLE